MKEICSSESHPPCSERRDLVDNVNASRNDEETPKPRGCRQPAKLKDIWNDVHSRSLGYKRNDQALIHMANGKFVVCFPGQPVQEAENVEEDVELVDAPEVVVGLLPDRRVREDEHGAHDGEQRDASQTGQRLQ